MSSVRMFGGLKRFMPMMGDGLKKNIRRLPDNCVYTEKCLQLEFEDADFVVVSRERVKNFELIHYAEGKLIFIFGSNETGCSIKILGRFGVRMG